MQIRKLENETTLENQRVNAKLDREIKSAKDKLRGEVRVLELDLKSTMRSF